MDKLAHGTFCRKSRASACSSATRPGASPCTSRRAASAASLAQTTRAITRLLAPITGWTLRVSPTLPASAASVPTFCIPRKCNSPSPSQVASALFSALARVLDTDDVICSCWDGKNLDSPNHQDHVSYPASGPSSFLTTSDCPASHPVKIPQLMLEVSLDTDGKQPCLWFCRFQLVLARSQYTFVFSQVPPSLLDLLKLT